MQRQVTAELTSNTTQGVVITHGTDTLEEKIFFLDLTISFEKPVVLVAAMRPASPLSTDGPLNLYQAVKLAVAPGAAGRGPMVTLNERAPSPSPSQIPMASSQADHIYRSRIVSAFYVSKNHANALDAFYAKEQGHLGFFFNQSPIFYYQATRSQGKPKFDISSLKLTTLPTVDVIFAHIGANPALIEPSVNSGA